MMAIANQTFGAGSYAGYLLQSTSALLFASSTNLDKQLELLRPLPTGSLTQREWFWFPSTGSSLPLSYSCSGWQELWPLEP
jgi:hypothetical protein